MLEIRNISKAYKTGDLVQRALDGVSLTLRDCEFVSILGPSGSGKTTLLNVIGGLDRYDSGDLLINGRSTKEYGDRDWDSYRNHSIGFVFQSYNLIPHQSVLSNVELALTIGGVSRAERKRRAREALREVGLEGQEHKRPNQMSGGQMQRVAIARALVNDPEILLADEPTGALDTETSLQVMELLKKVAEKRLVVMVTHNPELAERYSTRIVKLRDGRITDDSDPCEPESVEQKADKGKQAKMSFLTSLALSAQNLRTKKGRTLLTAFAGSIGIIGIALILALSSGVNNYIADIQKETMSSYPITITAQAFDLSGLIQQRSAIISARAEERENAAGKTNVSADFSNLESSEAITSSVAQNDLTAFKKYLDDPESEIHRYIGESGVIYAYNTSFEVFTRDADGLLQSTDADTSELASSSLSGMARMRAAMTGGSGAKNFSELMKGKNGAAVSQVVTDSYELLAGEWPSEYDELVLVLSERNTLSAEKLYQLGFMSPDEYRAAAQAIKNGGKAEETVYEYDALIGKSYYLIAACDRYALRDGVYEYIGDSVTEEAELLENAVELKIVGIVRPAEDAANANIGAAVGYTSLLTDYIVTHTNSSAVVKAQEAAPDVNVLTGMVFDAADDAQKVEDAKNYVRGLGVSDKAALYTMIQYYSGAGTGSGSGESTSGTTAATESTSGDTATAAGESTSGDTTATAGESTSGDTTAATESTSGGTTATATTESTSGDTTATAGENTSGDTTSTATAAATDESAMAMMVDAWLDGEPDESLLISLYDRYIAGGSFDENMSAFGKVSYDAPSSISIYTDSFEDKDAIAECIARYNETVDSDTKITYTDYVALITGSITSIVDVISYVLIAFVAVSLVVSCIMIGIITHISVLERTKEIGILRALGASKRNVSQVFNAETVIIGFCSGILGVAVSMLLTIPINAVLQTVTESQNVAASLPVGAAVILVVISVVITVIGGLIPAKSAAKKDPVIALRTE